MTDDWEAAYYYGLGHATTTGGPEPERPPRKVAAVLWIPDIDARHTWREHYVLRAQAPAPTTRHPMGFAAVAKPARPKRRH